MRVSSIADHLLVARDPGVVLVDDRPGPHVARPRAAAGTRPSPSARPPALRDRAPVAP